MDRAGMNARNEWSIVCAARNATAAASAGSGSGAPTKRWATMRLMQATAAPAPLVSQPKR